MGLAAPQRLIRLTRDVDMREDRIHLARDDDDTSLDGEQEAYVKVFIVFLTATAASWL